MAAEVNIELTKPRVPSVSRNRANAGDMSDNAETYFRKNIYYPFLDHCIAEFSQRFPDSAQSMFLGHKLMHGKVSDITNQEIESIKSFYGYDLPNVGCFES